MKSKLAWWLNDLRLALNVGRARRFRRNCSFSQRRKFDNALRPSVSNGVIAYPDAIYHITVDDLIRAMDAAYQPGVPSSE